MLKAMLVLVLAAVSTDAAARETVWTWDRRAPQKRGEAVLPNAVPGWVEIGSQKTYTIFVNPASIRKFGDNVEVSHLYQLQIIDWVAGKPIRSVMAHSEFSCVKGQARTLSAAAYSGGMGKADPNFRDGQFQSTNLDYIPTGLAPVVNLDIKGGRSGVVNNISEPGKWNPVAPGSTEEILMKFACAK
ncbi:MAG: surface-adhesin E family protein [Pseudomonadota bacterium]